MKVSKIKKKKTEKKKQILSSAAWFWNGRTKLYYFTKGVCLLKDIHLEKTTSFQMMTVLLSKTPRVAAVHKLVWAKSEKYVAAAVIFRWDQYTILCKSNVTHFSKIIYWILNKIMSCVFFRPHFSLVQGGSTRLLIIALSGSYEWP